MSLDEARPQCGICDRVLSEADRVLGYTVCRNGEPVPVCQACWINEGLEGTLVC